jgi:hypothetical protein
MSQQPSGESQTVSIRGRKLVQMVLAPLALVAFVVLVLDWKFPDVNFLEIPEGLLFLVCFSIFGLYLGVTLLTWRCPKCRTYLGKGLAPSSCPGCGVLFSEAVE